MQDECSRDIDTVTFKKTLKSMKTINGIGEVSRPSYQNSQSGAFVAARVYAASLTHTCYPPKASTRTAQTPLPLPF